MLVSLSFVSCDVINTVLLPVQHPNDKEFTRESLFSHNTGTVMCIEITAYLHVIIVTRLNTRLFWF